MKILPKPNNYVEDNSCKYSLKDNIEIGISNNLFINEADYLLSRLVFLTGNNFSIKKNSVVNGINFIFKKDLKDEAYILEVNVDGINIISSSPSGAFYAIQTFLQLIPNDLYTGKKLKNILITCCKIEDSPRYKWRGVMLDVSRHFYSVEDVKHYIDLVSMYKFNKLHLHLSDDQGWRIEIESWPKLNTIGSKSEVGNGLGGYYTKNEYREIVKYANSKYIEVIPEIDMPGHVNAILASYEELNRDGVKKDIYRGTKVGFSSLDGTKNITYKFIDDIIREISELTPGGYIHIGGDEAKKTDPVEYKDFIERVEKIVNSYGKIMIGWEETAKVDLDNSSIVQLWTPECNKTFKNIILSPAHHIYFDIKYNENIDLGHDWAGYTDLKKAYEWDIFKVYPNIDPNSIKGIESPIWTEFITNMKEIEFMSFPRLIGVAEKAWSMDSSSFSDYLVRLKKHLVILNYYNVNYYKCNYLTD